MTPVESPCSNGQVPVKNESKSDADASPIAADNKNKATQSANKEEVIEEISELKVNNLESVANAANGHQSPQNGASHNNNLSVDHKAHEHNEEENGAVPNGTLTKEAKKNKKKDKEKKTPKKSPRKVLAIIPGHDDEDNEKRHQAALTHTRPKCCTVS